MGWDTGGSPPGARPGCIGWGGGKSNETHTGPLEQDPAALGGVWGGGLGDCPKTPGAGPGCTGVGRDPQETPQDPWTGAMLHWGGPPGPPERGQAALGDGRPTGDHPQPPRPPQWGWAALWGAGDTPVTPHNGGMPSLLHPIILLVMPHGGSSPPHSPPHPVPQDPPHHPMDFLIFFFPRKPIFRRNPKTPKKVG